MKYVFELSVTVDGAGNAGGIISSLLENTTLFEEVKVVPQVWDAISETLRDDHKVALRIARAVFTNSKVGVVKRKYFSKSTVRITLQNQCSVSLHVGTDSDDDYRESWPITTVAIRFPRLLSSRGNWLRHHPDYIYNNEDPYPPSIKDPINLVEAEVDATIIKGVWAQKERSLMREQTHKQKVVSAICAICEKRFNCSHDIVHCEWTPKALDKRDCVMGQCRHGSESCFLADDLSGEGVVTDYEKEKCPDCPILKAADEGVYKEHKFLTFSEYFGRGNGQEQNGGEGGGE